MPKDVRSLIFIVDVYGIKPIRQSHLLFLDRLRWHTEGLADSNQRLQKHISVSSCWRDLCITC
jgi:hypothetical protein